MYSQLAIYLAKQLHNYHNAFSSTSSYIQDFGLYTVSNDYLAALVRIVITVLTKVNNYNGSDVL